MLWTIVPVSACMPEQMFFMCRSVFSCNHTRNTNTMVQWRDGSSQVMTFQEVSTHVISPKNLFAHVLRQISLLAHSKWVIVCPCLKSAFQLATTAIEVWWSAAAEMVIILAGLPSLQRTCEALLERPLASWPRPFLLAYSLWPNS